MFEAENDISFRTLPFLVVPERGRGRGREFESVIILSMFDILYSFQTYENKRISVNKNTLMFFHIDLE